MRSPDEVFDAAGQILDDKFNLPRTRSPEAAPDAVVRRMREARGLPAEDEGDSRRSARHMPQQNSTFGNVRRVDPATARARPSPAEHIAKLRAARGYLLTD